MQQYIEDITFGDALFPVVTGSCKTRDFIEQVAKEGWFRRVICSTTRAGIRVLVCPRLQKIRYFICCSTWIELRVVDVSTPRGRAPSCRLADSIARLTTTRRLNAAVIPMVPSIHIGYGCARWAADAPR